MRKKTTEKNLEKKRHELKKHLLTVNGSKNLLKVQKMKNYKNFRKRSSFFYVQLVDG